MAIKAKISVDNSELTQGLQQAEIQAKKTGQVMNKGLGSKSAGEALERFGDSADNAVRAMDSVAGAAGAASTGFSGIAGDIVSLVKNPMSMLIAALGVLVTVGVNAWQRLTESAEEYYDRLQKNAQYAKEKSDEIANIHNEEEEYLNILEELSRQEKLNNSEKLLAITIITELTKRYGDLGISIDETTGKIIGLDNAFVKLLQKQTEAKKSAKLAEIKIAEKMAHAQASQMTKTLHIMKPGIGFNQTGEVAQNTYKDIREARNMGLDVKLNVSDTRTSIHTSQKRRNYHC